MTEHVYQEMENSMIEVICPTSVRISGERNPDYGHTLVFENDFAALQKHIPDSPDNTDPLFQVQAERGEAHVVCFSPDHSKSLPELALSNHKGNFLIPFEAIFVLSGKK